MLQPLFRSNLNVSRLLYFAEMSNKVKLSQEWFSSISLIPISAEWNNFLFYWKNRGTFCHSSGSNFLMFTIWDLHSATSRIKSMRAGLEDIAAIWKGVKPSYSDATSRANSVCQIHLFSNVWLIKNSALIHSLTSLNSAFSSRIPVSISTTILILSLFTA